MGRISRVFHYVSTTPWALLPARAEIMFEVLRDRASSGRICSQDVEVLVDESKAYRRARVEAAEKLTRQTDGVVAVVPVTGTFVHRAYEVSNLSGGGLTSSEALAQTLSELDDNPRVARVVLDVDSPGGSVYGMPELAAAVQRMSTPVTAVANAMMASAAYWLGSQANELVVTPSGEVGSIGVIKMHEDWSAALEQEGVKVTLLAEGRYKSEGSFYEPLSDEARLSIQGRLAEYYGMFVDAVARGRGVSAGDVRAGFGEGRMVGAARAVELGMADRVATLEETVARLADQSAQASPRRRSSAAVTPEEPTSSEEPGLDDPARDPEHSRMLARRRRFEMLA